LQASETTAQTRGLILHPHRSLPITAPAIRGMLETG
jgi:hypothetical protein